MTSETNNEAVDETFEADLTARGNESIVDANALYLRVKEGEDTPYVGLAPFGYNERLFFFGRRKHVDALLDRIARENKHLVAIIGESGCGKSSVVRAGLLPELRAGRLMRTAATWHEVIFTPGSTNPFLSLATALSTRLKDKTVGQIEAAIRDDQLQKILGSSVHRPPLGDEHGAENWLLVVDQFEELFDQIDDKAIAREFVRFLLSLIDEKHFYLALTLRAERVGDCARFDRLTNAVFEGLYLVPPLEISEIQLAIRAPANLFGCNVDDSLIAALINDPLRRDRDYLPLLQYALVRIWQIAKARCRRTNSTQLTPDKLTLQDYEDASRSEESTTPESPSESGAQSVRRPLEAELERLLGEIKPGDREIGRAAAELVFSRLVFSPRYERTVTHAVRARATLTDFYALLSDDGPLTANDVLSAVNRFRGGGFLTPTTAEVHDLDANCEITLTHESLIRQWGRFSGWTRKEAAAADTFRDLEERTRDWMPGQPAELTENQFREAQQWRSSIKNHDAWSRRYEQIEDDIPDPSTKVVGSPARRILAFLDSYEKSKSAQAQLLATQAKNLRRLKQGSIAGVVLAILAIAGFVVYAAEHDAELQAHEAKAKQADIDALRTFDMESQGDPFERLTKAEDAFYRNSDATTAEALRSAMWSDALPWIRVEFADKHGDLIVQHRFLLPDGSVLLGATKDAFVLWSTGGERRLPICDPLRPLVNQNWQYGVTPPSATLRVAVFNTTSAKACVYDLSKKQPVGIPIDFGDNGFDENKLDFALAPDGRAVIVSSSSGRILMATLDQVSDPSVKPQVIDLSECRETSANKWELRSLYVGNAHSDKQRMVVALGGRPSDGTNFRTGEKYTAVLCEVFTANDGSYPDSHRVSQLEKWELHGNPNIQPPIEFSPTTDEVLLIESNRLRSISLATLPLRKSDIHPYDGNSNPIRAATYLVPDTSQGGKARVFVSGEKTSGIWAQGLALTPAIAIGHDSNLVHIDAEGRHLLEIRADSSARVWDVADGVSEADISFVPKNTFIWMATNKLIMEIKTAGGEEPTYFYLPLDKLPWQTHGWRTTSDLTSTQSANTDTQHSQKSEILVTSAHGSCGVEGLPSKSGPAAAQTFRIAGSKCETRALPRLNTPIVAISGISDEGTALLAFGQSSNPGESNLILANVQESLSPNATKHSDIEANGVQPFTTTLQSANPLAALSGDGLTAIAVTQSPGAAKNIVANVRWIYRATRTDRMSQIDAPVDTRLSGKISAVGISANGLVAAIATSTGEFEWFARPDRPQMRAPIQPLGLLAERITQLGVSDSGRYTVAGYWNGTLAIFDCGQNPCTEFLRDRQHMPLSMGSPRISEEKPNGEGGLSVEILASVAGVDGTKLNRILTLQCLDECSARDVSLLEAAAKKRLNIWRDLSDISSKIQ